MARKARIKSSTGIYHVLVRAIADLQLFTDEEDTQIYTGILNDLQHQGRCEIFAYALFPTHVHLLIRAELNETAAGLRNEQSSTKQAEPYENESSSEVFRSANGSYEPIGSIMKRLASAYSYFFNVKYDHYGPIYLDRFKSNPVETRDYYLQVLHHIGAQDTQWKYTCRHIPSGLPNETAAGLRNEQSSKKQAEPYENEDSSVAFRSKAIRSEAIRSDSVSSSPPLLEYRERSKRITDSRLLTYLQTNFQFTDIPEFLQRAQEEQKAVISNCKKIGGSIRQIVRLTGSPYQAVFQIK